MPISFRVIVRDKVNLQSAANKVKDSRSMLREIKEYRNKSFALSISSNKDARGIRVKPLSAKYAEEKRRSGFGSKPIRVRSGTMINSYRSRIYRDRVIETVENYLAIFHQNGTEKMPRRQLLPESFSDMPKSEQKNILRIMNDFMRNIFRNDGRGFGNR